MSNPLLADVLRERAAANRAALGGYESGGADVNRSGAPIYEAMSSQPFAQAIARGQLPAEPSLQTLPHALSVVGEAMSDLQGNRPGWQMAIVDRGTAASRFLQLFPKAYAAMNRDLGTRYAFSTQRMGPQRFGQNIYHTRPTAGQPDVDIVLNEAYYQKYLVPGGPTKLLEDVKAGVIGAKDARSILNVMGHEAVGHGMPVGKARAADAAHGRQMTLYDDRQFHARPGSQAQGQVEKFLLDKTRRTPDGGRPSDPYLYQYATEHPLYRRGGNWVGEGHAEAVGSSMAKRSADAEFRDTYAALLRWMAGYR